jgi:hypothetical protein
MTLNEKIGNILKRHPEGKEFFDILDATIRGDYEILDSFMDFVKRSITRADGIVLTGEFGRVLVNNHLKSLLEISTNIILANGGIRGGEEVELYKDFIDSPYALQDFWKADYIFLDDSIYSGITSLKIEAKIKELNETCRLFKVFVVYDGGLEPRRDVYSMYRYHKK